jgi:hypothetical protein
LDTKRTGGWLHDELTILVLRALAFLRFSGSVRIGVAMLRRMRVGTLDLNKAFRADRLVATPGPVQVGRII